MLSLPGWAMFPLLKRFLARFFWRWRPRPGSPEDPYAGVRAPRTRGPGGRGAAVAVMEPEPDASVAAVGRPR